MDFLWSFVEYRKTKDSEVYFDATDIDRIEIKNVDTFCEKMIQSPKEEEQQIIGRREELIEDLQRLLGFVFRVEPIEFYAKIRRLFTKYFPEE